MKKEFRLVEKFKWFALVSLIIMLIGGVFMAVRGMNFGIDFTGGAKVEIDLGAFADDSEVKKAFEEKFVGFFEDKGLKVADKMLTSPNDGGVTYEFRLEYYLKSRGGKLSNSAEDQQAFIDFVKGDDADDTNNGIQDQLAEQIKTYFETDELMKSKAAYYDDNSVHAGTVGATASASLISAAIWATVAAIAVIFVWIIIRFKSASGIAAVIALLHDILLMVALTTIFHISVNSTFIAAIITIVGYSINASIVIFDKVRECEKSAAFAQSSDEEIANYSVKHSFTKILLSTLTTLIMVVVLVFFSMSTIQEFILPIIFGLICGTYSSLFLSPAIWVGLRKLGAKIKAKNKERKALKARNA